MKKTALMLLFISATIFATAEVVHPFLYADTPYSPVHYVCDSPLNMRSSPGRDGQIIKRLSLGETVTLLEAGESETIDGITAWWYRALAEDKTEGWVFGGFLASQTLSLDLNTNGISDYVFFRVHSRDKQYFFDPERDLLIYIDGRRISANMISSYIEQPSHINFFMNRTRDTVALVLYNEYTPADQEWRDPVEYHLFKLDAQGLSFITSSIDMTGTIKPAIEAELGPGMFGLNHLVTYISQGSYGHVQEKHITAMPFRQMKTVPGGLVRQTLSITGHKTERMFNWVKPYRIGENEVTWDLWFQVMTQSEKLGYKFSGEETPGSLEKSASGIPDEQTADYPVGNISWSAGFPPIRLDCMTCQAMFQNTVTTGAQSCPVFSGSITGVLKRIMIFPHNSGFCAAETYTVPVRKLQLERLTVSVSPIKV